MSTRKRQMVPRYGVECGLNLGIVFEHLLAGVIREGNQFGSRRLFSGGVGMDRPPPIGGDLVGVATRLSGRRQSFGFLRAGERRCGKGSG